MTALERWSILLPLVLSATTTTASDECSLYLAETVDDRGGLTMGVFTSQELPKGSLVGTPDVVIPLVDIPLHNSPTHEDEQEFWWVWNDFVWNPMDVGGLDEGADVKSAAMGMGSLVRGHGSNSNAMIMRSEYNDAGLHRSKSPGTGAISYYANAATIASRDIQAGEEVFFHHGYHWYLHPQDQEQALLEQLPMENPRVQEFWKRYQELEQKHGKALSSELRTKLWGILQESPMDTAVHQMLPYSWTDANTVAEHVTNQGKRSTTWLKKHGMCLDNIRQDASTVPHAGRGAFATRKLKKSTLIAPTPMIHIVDKGSLDMYTPHIDEETFEYVMTNDVSKQQLLLNYCFGHHESTKLLCPLGSGTSFINHSPTPNAAVRWSTHESSLHQNEWLNMTVAELGDKLNIGLMLEYYALRDIEEGEEIFINYGPAWEEAWNDHVESWEKPRHAEDYVSATDMNSFALNALHTVDEQSIRGMGYPESVVTSCYYEYSADKASGFVDYSGGYADPSDYRVTIREWNGMKGNVPDYHFLRPCRILERQSIMSAERIDEYEYTVQMLNQEHAMPDQKIPEHELLIIKRVPRNAITFTDFHYATDLHLPNAFRHEMMMDNALFPNTWRNLRPSSSTRRTSSSSS